MKPEENSPASATPPEDHDRLMWRLWCVTMAVIIVGGLLWGGVLVVNYPRTYPVRKDYRPPVIAPNGENVVRPRQDLAVREPSSSAIAAPGIVWVNTQSRIYHFSGYRWYGRTIHGKYIDEEDAIAEGDRAAKNERRPTAFDAAKQ